MLTCEITTQAAGLADIDDKLQAGERLTLEDGVRLFDAPDLLAVGWLANREREKRHGARTYFNYNLRLEPTNVCEASCLFCSFARLKPGMPEAYTMSLEQAWDKLRQRANQPLTELHIVNGLNPDLPFSYYTDLLRGFKRIRPGIHLKCFTAVEIAFFADLYGMTDEQVLRELMDAGLDSLPGGGAEIFAERVRQKICHDKCGADRYLAIHRIAHRLGHAHQRHDAVRPHRDDGGARRSHAARASAAGRDRRLPGVHPARVPSRQQPDAQAAGAERHGHAARARRVAADARQHSAHQGVLDCDRVELAQTALWFGVDDLDGTVQEEKIYHMAGSPRPKG